MKKRIEQYAKVLVFLILGIVLLWLITRGQDLDVILTELKNANYLWIGLVMIISLLSHLMRASRWNILISTTGYTPGLKQTFIAVMSGYLSNLAIPRLGEITKCAALSKTGKIPFNILIGTVVSERVVDFISLVVILIFTIGFQFGFVEGFLSEFFFRPLYTLGAQNIYLLITVSVLLVVFMVSLALFLRKKLRDPESGSFFYRLRHHIKGFMTGVKTLWQMKQKWVFFFQTLAIWGMYYLTVYLAFFAISGTSHLTPMAGLTLLAVGSIAIVAPMPGGIGAYHFVTIITLTELYDIVIEQATSYAYIAHASQMLIIILAGTAAWVALSLFDKKQPLEKTSSRKYSFSQLNK
ncbi:MAG: lysylphosphatidylglycerol synthase transmembrane domain-containing protein [Bacteroidales bacterium]